ncbi:uncharacterized protein LOC143144766 isoform X2 [Ptiloglossa arizonensis]|uniref:uncharacterized protein LOC143144766 isoform X2 n=1 Tax=Ptiloglossa arizonensis TaxID=3350558 RepID=UPI003FA106DF
MHYPLHITVFCAGLWILRGGAHAAKTGVNPEVLTSFAKNVASVLSSTLLGDFQDSSTNQSSSASNWSSSRKAHETRSLNAEINASPGNAGKAVARSKRFALGPRSSDEGGKSFRDDFARFDVPGYERGYNQEPVKASQFSANGDSRLPRDEGNLEAAENVNSDTRSNTIDADIDAASLHLAEHYHRRLPGYKPDIVDSLENGNHYGQFGFHPNYLHRATGTGVQPLGVEGIGTNPPTNRNVQPTRIIHRPYNLNYQGPFHDSQHPPFDRHPTFLYPNGRGNGQPPGNEQVDENSASRLTEDQNQGQSAIGGYDYNPRFQYRPPYQPGFYGPPYFYNPPYNDSFDPGNGEQPGNNSSNGNFPNGFPGYGYSPYGPYQPYYPNFNGYGKHPQPQPANENLGNTEQPANGQANGNVTHNQPPYGYPGNGPFYGDFHFPGYPLGPFNGGPYHRFNHGFHYHLTPRFKGAPFLHPEPYGHFPSGPWYPFGGPYPKNNGHPPSMTENSPKPAEVEKTVNAGPENSSGNSDAEMISKIKRKTIESLPSHRYEKILFPWPLAKENDKVARREVNVDRDSKDRDA